MHASPSEPVEGEEEEEPADGVSVSVGESAQEDAGELARGDAGESARGEAGSSTSSGVMAAPRSVVLRTSSSQDKASLGVCVSVDCMEAGGDVHWRLSLEAELGEVDWGGVLGGVAVSGSASCDIFTVAGTLLCRSEDLGSAVLLEKWQSRPIKLIMFLPSRVPASESSPYHGDGYAKYLSLRRECQFHRISCDSVDGGGQNGVVAGRIQGLEQAARRDMRVRAPMGDGPTVAVGCDGSPTPPLHGPRPRKSVTGLLPTSRGDAARDVDAGLRLAEMPSSVLATSSGRCHGAVVRGFKGGRRTRSPRRGPTPLAGLAARMLRARFGAGRSRVGVAVRSEDLSHCHFRGDGSIQHLSLS